jgi:(4S)-4-hydroxy-5-phosphonooxypentane-2,3-dione isomerase
VFIVSVELLISAEHRHEFMSAMLANAQASLRDEPGCTQFDVSVRIDDPNTVLLYERYNAASDFQLHLKTAHFLAFDERVTPWVRSKTVATWTLMSSP